LVGEVVKVADFGLSTPIVTLQSPRSRAGTLDFAAPEVHRGNLADSSDQYSLAISYYYLRTGTFPFPAIAQGFQRQYSYNRPAPDLGGVHRSERRVLERSLDLEPTNRWPSCSALMSHLDVACHCPDVEAAERILESRLSRV
jgi:serine/threonine protein kinase